MGRAPVGDSLLGDASLALEGLINLVNSRNESIKVNKIHHDMAPHQKPSLNENDNSTPISASSLFKTLRSNSPENTILVEESPSNLAELHSEWPISHPDSFYTSAGGSLGWNLPAAVGIALGERESKRNRPIVAVIGDGSFQYSIQALWTPAQHSLQIIFVVPKNNEYGILKSFSILEETAGVPGLDLPDIDFVALAKGYGCQAIHAETVDEIRLACEKGFNYSGPTVIEVPISNSIPPLI